MEIECVREYDRFVLLEREWNKFLFNSDLNGLFLTHEWFSAWWQNLSGRSELNVLIFRDDNGEIFGLAPLRINKGRVLFIASHEVTDFCDFITYRQNRELFFRSFLTLLQEDYSHISHFEFINIKETSPTLLHIPAMAAEFGFKCTQVESDVSLVLELPSSYDVYISGLQRKNRHELRRKLRKMESLGDQRSVKITSPEEILPAVDSFIEMHQASSSEKKKFWQKEGMVNFFRDSFFVFADRGWVEMNGLYVKDALVAALLSFSYENDVLFYNIAYKTDFAPYSPGFYLFNSSILEAIAANKNRVDFLRGREKYKYEFGAKECKIYSLILAPGDINI
jgi:CelD/BcsL family acetyltransferase involved in cellulose biosynthesis